MSKLKDGIDLNINELLKQLDNYNVVTIQSYTFQKVPKRAGYFFL